MRWGMIETRDMSWHCGRYSSAEAFEPKNAYITFMKSKFNILGRCFPPDVFEIVFGIAF